MTIVSNGAEQDLLSKLQTQKNLKIFALPGYYCVPFILDMLPVNKGIYLIMSLIFILQIFWIICGALSHPRIACMI